MDRIITIVSDHNDVYKYPIENYEDCTTFELMNHIENMVLYMQNHVRLGTYNRQLRIVYDAIVGALEEIDEPLPPNRKNNDFASSD